MILISIPLSLSLPLLAVSNDSLRYREHQLAQHPAKGILYVSPRSRRAEYCSTMHYVDEMQSHSVYRLQWFETINIYVIRFSKVELIFWGWEIFYKRKKNNKLIKTHTSPSLLCFFFYFYYITGYFTSLSATLRCKSKQISGRNGFLVTFNCEWGIVMHGDHESILYECPRALE